LGNEIQDSILIAAQMKNGSSSVSSAYFLKLKGHDCQKHINLLPI